MTFGLKCRNQLVKTRSVGPDPVAEHDAWLSLRRLHFYSPLVERLLTGSRGSGSLFDEFGCLLWMRHIGHMARIHFNCLSIGTLGHHALLVRIDRPVGGRHHVPGGLGLPGGRRDLVSGRGGGDRHLRYSHVVGLGWRNIRREVGREMLLFYPPVAVAVWLECLGGFRQGPFDRRAALTVIHA